MANTFKDASDEILATLGNAKRIAVVRQDRRLAMDILRACSLYIKGTRFPCDHKVFDRLAESIIDKQSSAIMEEFAKVEKVLAASFKAVEHRTWRTLRLPR